MNLHSNMSLLISSSTFASFTFAEKFTFQYVSINMNENIVTEIPEGHLHSNMSLLI